MGLRAFAAYIYVGLRFYRRKKPAPSCISNDFGYSKALTVVTGSFGWPLTAILNPHGEPLFINAFLPHDQLATFAAPHIDQKINTAWNALFLWGLAEAYEVTADENIKTYQPRCDD